MDIAAATQIGSEDQPVVVIIDTPDGSDERLGHEGYRRLLRHPGGAWATLTFRGTCSVHGAVFTSGTMDNKGTGSVA